MNPFCPGNAGVAPLRTTTTVSSAVLLAPGEVVVVVHELLLAPAEDRHDLARDPLAPGVRVLAGQRHQRPVVLPHRLVERQQHLPLRHARSPLRPLRDRQEAGRDGVPEPAAPEMHPDPDGARLVNEHVHVVIAAADGAELRARLAAEPLPRGARNRVPRRALEQRDARSGASSERFLRPTPKDTTSWISSAIAGSRRQSEIRERQVGADGRVAARDVEADAHDGHLVAVCRDPANRHDVAEVAVRHEGRPLGAAGDVLELRERVRLVRAEDGDVVHGCCLSCCLSASAMSTRTMSRDSGVTAMSTLTNCRTMSALVVACRDNVSVRKLPPPPSARIGSS